MKNTNLLVVLILIASVAAVLAQNTNDRGNLTTSPVFTGLLRQGTENKLSSPRDPNVVLEFGPTFHHLGGQKFVLYGVADTEQHFFVEATPEKRLKSLYWIQFEEYLPDNTYTYDYETASRITLNNYEFYLDTVPVQSDAEKSQPGSDGALTRQFLESKGYKYPEQYFLARLLYFTDKSRRKELMIIFIEDLSSTGLTASDLSKDGKAADRWPEIEKKYLDRIKATLKVMPLQSN